MCVNNDAHRTRLEKRGGGVYVPAGASSRRSRKRTARRDERRGRTRNRGATEEEISVRQRGRKPNESILARRCRTLNDGGGERRGTGV